jgi:hypothetical protein
LKEAVNEVPAPLKDTESRWGAGGERKSSAEIGEYDVGWVLLGAEGER